MQLRPRRSWVSVRPLTDIPTLTTALSLAPAADAPMYDVELVRHLCRQIRAESDPDKVQDLVSLLNAALRNAQQESQLGLFPSPKSMRLP
jgi:hypothetical protein